MSPQKRACVLLIFLLPIVGGCQITPRAEDFFKPVSLEQRQLESQTFEADDEIAVLKTCTTVLQDNGFQVIEAESSLGLIVASKTKMVNGMLGSVGVTVVTRPVQKRSGGVGVRVTFHSTSVVNDPAIYQEFFKRLSKALFMEAQKT